MISRLAELIDHAADARDGAACGRYAPSPTGALHLGNLRTALVAWLQARIMDGIFVLRIEDLDKARNKPGAVAAMMRDLRRLGLDWDEGPDSGGQLGPYSQLEREEIYRAAFECLEERGTLFPCFCSRKDIREAASAPHGAAAVYPGTCRPAAGGPRSPRRGRAPAWRFEVGAGPVRFHDCLQGMYHQDLEAEVGDFVVKRRDGVFAYQLAVVVDDATMGITDVVRGEDLIDSTPRQIALQEALGVPTPRYWHVPVLVDEQGERLSKRDGSASLAEYCAAGGTPETLVGRFAAELSLVEPGAVLSARELLGSLALSDLFRHTTTAVRDPAA